MKYIIVKNDLGHVVACGEADGMFEPSVPAGCIRTIEAAPVAIYVPYQEKRTLLYPPLSDEADAQVKMRHPDPAIQAIGAAELAAYDAKCWAVKEAVPKV